MEFGNMGNGPIGTSNEVLVVLKLTVCGYAPNFSDQLENFGQIRTW